MARVRGGKVVLAAPRPQPAPAVPATAPAVPPPVAAAAAFAVVGAGSHGDVDRVEASFGAHRGVLPHLDFLADAVAKILRKMRSGFHMLNESTEWRTW